MSYLDLYGLPSGRVDAMPHQRGDVVAAIDKERRFDVIVVGGGIHGATMARLCAFNGLKTLLLERDDYASGTSSRSSKMAHGGLRYLEMFDFKQVFEGIRAREDLFQSASHLVHRTRFLIPVYNGQKWYRRKMCLGLSVYDLMVFRRDSLHKWLLADELDFESFSPNTRNLEGCISYVDGIMNDTRLVIENVRAARQEGALCLNYAEVVSSYQGTTGLVRVGWRDLRSSESHEAECGVVVNCAGPWAPELGRLSKGELASVVRYSQGSHLIFNRPWKDPPIFLPLEGKARYYWVWPHQGGTMVGTTEREVTELVRDPVPFEDEVEEILGRVERDLPDSGLNRKSLHYCFAGVRTLAVSKGKRGKSGEVPLISRGHRWSYQQGVLSLVGGKFTTALWTAEEGLKEVMKLASLPGPVTSLRGRPLPGAYRVGIKDDFLTLAVRNGIPLEIATRAVGRFGARIDRIQEYPNWSEVLGGVVLRGEVQLAFEEEQVESLEDLMRRRLELEYLPGHGMSALPQIGPIYMFYHPEANFDAEVTRYKARIGKLRAIMNLPNF